MYEDLVRTQRGVQKIYNLVTMIMQPRHQIVVQPQEDENQEAQLPNKSLSAQPFLEMIIKLVEDMNGIRLQVRVIIIIQDIYKYIELLHYSKIFILLTIQIKQKQFYCHVIAVRIILTDKNTTRYSQIIFALVPKQMTYDIFQYFIGQYTFMCCAYTRMCVRQFKTVCA